MDTAGNIEKSGEERPSLRRRIAALALTTVALAGCTSSAESGEAPVESASATSEISVVDNSAPSQEKATSLALEEMENLSAAQRVDYCIQELLPKYDYFNLDSLVPDKPTEQILALNLSLWSRAHSEMDPKLLLCVFPVDNTGYTYDRDKILSGDGLVIPQGWHSMKELSRDSAEQTLELQWVLKDLQGSTLENTARFEYVSGEGETGLYLMTHYTNVLTEG